ncbi:SLATT domain-containing protein [Streptomyces sp. NPDC005143]
MQTSGESGRRTTEKDVHPNSLPDPANAVDGKEAVTILFRWLEAETLRTIDWYLTEKRGKALLSRTLRASSVLFFTAGAILPIMMVALRNPTGALWGYVLLALGASCLGLDKAFGFSASWTRYISTAAQLKSLLSTFQVQWALLSTESESPQWLESASMLLRKFSADVESCIEAETVRWVADFNANLIALETEIQSGPPRVIA